MNNKTNTATNTDTAQKGKASHRAVIVTIIPPTRVTTPILPRARTLPKSRRRCRRPTRRQKTKTHITQPRHRRAAAEKQSGSKRCLTTSRHSNENVSRWTSIGSRFMKKTANSVLYRTDAIKPVSSLLLLTLSSSYHSVSFFFFRFRFLSFFFFLFAKHKRRFERRSFRG